MSLFVKVLLVLGIPILGAIITYIASEREGQYDKKVKFAVMVFFIILFVILFILYEGAVSAWIKKLLNSSAS